MANLTLVVDETAGNGMRLDRYCALQPGAISRSRLKNGTLSVQVNGQDVKPSRTVRPRDVITVTWEDPVPETIEPENLSLEILYEDDNVTVVNKKQGMVTHPAVGNWTGTLVHALLWHWKQETPAKGLRPGIVHRLDKDTSGIIITARNPDTETFLQGEFRSRRVKKIYAAILSGVPPSTSGIIETQILRDPRNRKRFTWSDNPEKGKHAKTGYQVVHVYGPYALVLFRLYTGRTHQIRVHSKFIGCSILGDPVYGKKDPLFPGATLMLHSKTLRIRLPPDMDAKKSKSEMLTVHAPLPLRFRKVIRTLREKFGK